MTSPKEIVLQTLNFENPERVAQSFPESDIVPVKPTPVNSRQTEWVKVTENKWEHFDLWGNHWSRIDPTSKGEIEKGVIEDLDKIDDYEFPDFTTNEAFSEVKETVKANPDKFVVGGIFGMVFSIARKMRKLDQYLMDILLEPEKISHLHDRIEKVLHLLIKRHAESGVDGIIFYEDWGTQTGTLVSPELWRQEFFPRFKRICDLSHELKLKVFMHSCGQIKAIIPGLIEAGIDCFQFDQPELHGLDVLASYQKKNKITFWSPVDVQTTLLSKDKSMIQAVAREMIDKLWQGRGGFIAGFYPDETSIGLEPEWQKIASDEFNQYGISH